MAENTQVQNLADAINSYMDSKLATIGGGASYTLPTASTTQKGGVVIGAGLSMAGDTLNVTIASEAYTLPTASSSTKGGVKIGTGLSMSGDTLNCTVTGGQSYSIATSSQAGLMSAEDKQHLDAVVTVVGGKFLPSVDSFSEFLIYKDSNLPYLDNTIKRLLDIEYNGPSYENAFLNGDVYVYTAKDGLENQLWSSNGTYYKPCNNDSSTLRAEFESSPYKISEIAGFFIRHPIGINKDYEYGRYWCADSFQLNSAGNVTAGTSNVSLCGPASSVASAEGWNAIEWIPSMTDPNHLLFLATIGSNTNDTVYYTTISFNGITAVQTRTKAMTSIGVIYAEPKSKTNLDVTPTPYFPIPTFTFGDGKVTVGANTSVLISHPFVCYEIKTRDASNDWTVSNKYALLHHGFGAPSLYHYETYDYNNPENNITNPWLTDDNNVIAGVWQTIDDKIYAVTFKKGVYDYSSDWFNECSTVWTFDFKTPQVFKTSKMLSSVIDSFIM